jgi:hypothetical protein
LLFAALAMVEFNSAAQVPAITNTVSAELSPYLEPRLLTGKICDSSEPEKVLFHFQRTATNSGSLVYVLREYTLAGGKLASRERVVYDGNRLLSYQLEDLQAGTQGKMEVKPVGKNSKEEQINFQFVKGTTKTAARESFEKNTLINDMVAPFITDHWSGLTNGKTVKLRLVAMSRAETVGFKLTQISQGLWQGKPVVTIRMEPASLVIAQFIDPLLFTIEKSPPHRVLQYSGRTTPSILRKGKWQDLDALTVFDW